MFKHTLAAGLPLAVIAAVLATPAAAQDVSATRIDIPGQDLETSLRAIGRLTGRQIIIAAGALDGRQAPALQGAFTPEQAVARLTDGSGLPVRVTPEAILVGESVIVDPATEADPGSITVIGTRIRGGVVAAPVTTVRTDDAVLEGKHSLAEMIATIPQNFGGGQNPASTAAIPGSGNETGGSAFNLRGLGSDATLTLIDGHRVSYGGSVQAIDIGAVPFLAVDRIEVVADGGSALYGSDAVAGVANVLLRANFDGLKVGATAGFPTDGGGVSQQYGAIAGTSWTSGSVYAAYEHGKVGVVNSNDRAFARALAPNSSLYPALEHNNAMVKFRQDVVPGLSLELSGLYNQRTGEQFYPFDRVNVFTVSGYSVTTRDKSFAVLPTLRAALGPDWNVTASGTYAQEHTDYTQVQHFAGRAIVFNTCYCNSTASAEINADGPIFELPAGSVRLAVGTGYRSSRFAKTDAKVAATQDNHFVFGELEVPVVSPEQGLTGVHRLVLNIAGRYEDYHGVGTVITPKVGMVYAPFEGLDLKASWGTSFRAPTLFQQYNSNLVALYSAAAVGATTAPPGSTALVYVGGNRDLAPEKARTLVLAADWRPTPRAHFELSYFDIRYRDRIVSPVTYLSQAVTDPAYVAYLTASPTVAQQSAVLALAPLVNTTASPYDASKVIAIVRNAYVNAQSQKVHGVDLAADYTIPAGSGQLTFSATGSYIESTQKISAGQPVTQLAGTLYRPAHLKGRAGLRYADDQFTAAAFVNRVGGVKDMRLAAVADISGQTTFDLAFTLRPRLGGLLENLQITIWGENLTNDLPQFVRQVAIGVAPYDTANYSAVGRTVGFTISNRW